LTYELRLDGFSFMSPATSAASTSVASSGVGADSVLPSFTPSSMASLHAEIASPDQGILRTKPMVWHSGDLLLNADSSVSATDQLLVQVVDAADNRTVNGYSFSDSIPFTGNSTAAAAQWKAGKSMQGLAGQTVAIDVQLVGTSKLYSLAGMFSFFDASA
jgi:hypothetical protein